MNSTIVDVSGLPEQVVRDIQKLVETIRDKIGEPKSSLLTVKLPRWDGTVIGRLSRSEIYDDDE